MAMDVISRNLAQENSQQLAENVNQFIDVNSQLADKAQQTDLEIEQARITNLATLAEGSTTGDAELIDARVGADGTIYDNVGTANREQFSNLVQQISIPITNSLDISKFTTTNSTTILTDDTLSVRATGSNVRALVEQITDIDCILNKKIYYKFNSLKVTNSDCISIDLIMVGTEGGISIINSVSTPTIDEIYLREGYFTLNSTFEGKLKVLIRHEYLDTITATDKIMELKEVMTIDTTAPFTTIREFTEDEINNTLAKYPNRWFSGTKNIFTVKEMYEQLLELNQLNDLLIEENTVWEVI